MRHVESRYSFLHEEMQRHEKEKQQNMGKVQRDFLEQKSDKIKFVVYIKKSGSVDTLEEMEWWQGQLKDCCGLDK